MRKLILFALFSLSATACLQTNNSSSDDGSVFGEVSGSPEFIAARAVLSANCVDCHIQHNYHVLSEAQLIASGDIVPGDAENSPIYFRLFGSSGPRGSKNMPQGGPMDSQDVLAIYNWIQNIAP